MGSPSRNRKTTDRTNEAIKPGRVALAAMVAGTVSGAPSTAWALVTGRDLLEATRAAGTLAPGRRDRPGVIAGGVVHVAVSIFWTACIAAIVRRRPLRARDGAVLGLAIAALDLGVIGRGNRALRALPVIPQWLDHAAFGALAAAVLAQPAARPARQRRRR